MTNLIATIVIDEKDNVTFQESIKDYAKYQDIREHRGFLRAGEPIQSILDERGKNYGHFIQNATLSQELKSVIEKSPNWKSAEADIKEGVSVIFQKIARLFCGNVKHIDSWRDIQGYAARIEERLEKEEKPF